jgi:hypothetical protein
MDSCIYLKFQINFGIELKVGVCWDSIRCESRRSNRVSVIFRALRARHKKETVMPL